MDGGRYAGVRVTVEARIATAAVKLRLDVDLGDPVTPAPRTLVLPARRLGMSDAAVLGYPIATVLAEKIVTALDLAALSSKVGPSVALRAPAWMACRRRLGRQEDELPEDLAEVVAKMAVFADGVLGGVGDDDQRGARLAEVDGLGSGAGPQPARRAMEATPCHHRPCSDVQQPSDHR